jgi:hypothetical protein
MTRRPDPAPAAWCAYAAAGLGGANLVTLGLLYAVEVPRGGPYVFGAINDFGGGLYFLSSIPVLQELSRRLEGDDAMSRAALGATVGSSAVAAASSFLLAVHKIPFAPSTAVTVGAILVQSAWLTAVSARLARRGRWPKGLARLGQGASVAMLAGLPIFSLGYLAPNGSALRKALFAVGGALGGAAWVSWPVWYLLVGRTLAAEMDGTGERPAP